MSSYWLSLLSQLICKHKLELTSLSISIVFLLTTLQRSFRRHNEYEHYQHREHLLHIITQQKRDELEHVIDHINRLLLEDERILDGHHRSLSTCAFDHGDHNGTIVFEPCTSMLTDENNDNNDRDDDDDDAEEEEEDEDEDMSENDSLLRRLKLTKPSRLKHSIDRNSISNWLLSHTNTHYDE
jgi:hypothetical protein